MNELFTLPNYQLVQLLYDGSRTLVYRGIERANSKPVILKILRNPHPTFNELVGFRNQYAIARHLEHPAIVRPLALERCGNGYALVMPDNGAIALCDYWQQSQRSPGEFFSIALQLAEALHYLAGQRIIHKDIKPSNIIIHPETRQVQLIDFSIATLLPKEQQQLINPNILEGTLAYISPEQTGRMNRGIDYRTDFYSLGVTFFELLTGKLPFESSDPMELVHCHIAKKPEALGNGQWGMGNGEEMPQVLSAIVMKLMAKNAEARYQSALGLKYDLERCQQQWEAAGEIASFELGERDACDRFVIPEKLYGREAEVAQLLAAFERISRGAEETGRRGAGEQGSGGARGKTLNPELRTPNSELLLVAGYSGVGKTAVVNEVHKPIVEKRGYFIKGKFDQFQRNIPLSAFVQAFRDLMGQLLGESDTQLQRWKEKILAALGNNGRVIIEVIPELESIIGPQPPVPELSGSAAQNRFNLLFEKFVGVFATAEHPLTIFLDDLQWADSASLNLLKLLMKESQGGYLLVLGAYRDNEVFPAHPLMLTLDELQQPGANVQTLTLAPLDEANIQRLVADTLLCSLEIAAPLSALVYQKTKGNPFFTTQFLQGLHENGCIVFDSPQGGWQCDLTQVRQLALTDDVVEFMVGRLNKLPAATQEVLKLAACIGNRFDLATLAVTCEESQEEVAANLWESLQEGFVIPENETYKFFQGEELETRQIEAIGVSYRFLHDRVQQAAYSLIPENQKQRTHLKIGRLLARQTKPLEIESNIFNLVSQFNAGLELAILQTEKEEIARYNLIACRKAKNSAAYQPAWSYAKIGIDLLAQSGWQKCYQLTLELYQESVELAYLNSDFQSMENLAEIFLQNARTFLETIKVHQVKIQASVAQSKLLEGIEIGLSALKCLGMDLPEEPTEEDLEQVLSEIDVCVGEKAIADLVNLPPMTDPNILATVQILSSLFAIAYFTNPNLCWLTVMKQVLLSLSYGNAPASAFAYANYGMMKCGMKQDIETGYKFGQLALSLLSTVRAKSIEAKVIYITNVGIKHWKEKLHHTVVNLKEVYLKGLETGDLEFAGYGAATYCYYSYLPGKNLKDIDREMETYGLKIREIKQQSSLIFLNIFWQAIANLQQKSQRPWELEGEIYSEQEIIPIHLQNNDNVGLGYLYFNKLILAYLFGDYAEAALLSAEAKKYSSALLGIPVWPFYSVYDSLTQLALYSDATEEVRGKIWSQLEANQAQLKLWAASAPMNCQHKYDLVEAEKARVLGEKSSAIDLYDRAIVGARENEYIQEEALANELAAQFYLDWGKEKAAAGYMQEAYYCYSRWGAKAKVKDLETRYPILIAPILERQKLSLTPSATIAELTTGTISKTTTGTGGILDLATLMKALRTLSEEISLEGAIANLMQVAMENAGAETVALMLFQGRALMLTAQVTNQETPKIDPIPVETSNAVPLSIVNQVKRNREPIVLENASHEAALAGDAYIQKYQPQSILCLPLVDRGQPIGILYLENNQVAGAFTSDRLEVLNLLCSQAAIALENAQLYQQSQDYAQQLEQSQLQLIQSEKMSALGNLIAGVAHEINNPIGFIHGNVSEALNSVADITEYLQLYQETFPAPGEEIVEKAEELDIEYQLDDLPKMLNSMKLGCERIKNISTSLRTFSRADSDRPTRFNVHDGIDSTLLILKHRLKANDSRPAIEIIKSYGQLPSIECFPGQVNQVFMNILANAIDVFDEAARESSFAELRAQPQTIAIQTALNEKNVLEIRIRDNGRGMPEDVKARIFDHLFTTKEVGQGTGLGLAIARQIVTETHGGSLEVQSELGKGTVFCIQLPISC